ncbi:MAG: hypothetical protein KatS3mg002_0358 [Candidatus Woesearchaeota archaeon]|nr:MAG: hypothetical protein KatS3mg002_0358 [Candidatus Woesearchaeota archaeon]
MIRNKTASIKTFLFLYKEYESYLSALNYLINYRDTPEQNIIFLEINNKRFEVSNEFTNEFINLLLTIVDKRKKELIEMYSKINLSDDINQEINDIIKNII